MKIKITSIHRFGAAVLWLVALHVISSPILAQENEVLSLQQCYEKALKNSPNLQKRSLDVTIGEIAIFQSKMDFLPNLNAGATHGYNWGQSIDPFTNTFATGRVRTNNFAMIASWEIFTGLMKRYQLQWNEVNKQNSALIFDLEKRNFKNEIAAVYAKLQADYLVQSLYQEQSDLIQILYDNVAAKERVGRKSPFDKMRIAAVVQQDSALLIAANNTKRYTQFILKQLINEKDSSLNAFDFKILNEAEMRSKLKRFSDADINLDTLQELQLAVLNKERAELEYKLAKSQLLPTLSLNSAVGSGYSGMNQELIGTTLTPKPMDVQLRENLYQTAVLHLSIPIFNAYRVKSAIKIAQVRMQQASLDLEQVQIDLINSIERLLLEYENENINLQAKFTVANTNQSLFEASEKMFLTGVINYAEYAEARFMATQSRLDYLLSLSQCYGILLTLENLLG